MPWSFDGWRKKTERVVISPEETSDQFSEQKLDEELRVDRSAKAAQELAEANTRAEAEALEQQYKAAQQRRIDAEKIVAERQEEVKREERRRRTLRAELAREEMAVLQGMIELMKLSEQVRREARKAESDLNDRRNQIKWKDKGFR
jgi:hypothetical protein